MPRPAIVKQCHSNRPCLTETIYHANIRANISVYKEKVCLAVSEANLKLATITTKNLLQRKVIETIQKLSKEYCKVKQANREPIRKLIHQLVNLNR